MALNSNLNDIDRIRLCYLLYIFRKLLLQTKEDEKIIHKIYKSRIQLLPLNGGIHTRCNNETFHLSVCLADNLGCYQKTYYLKEKQ